LHKQAERKQTNFDPYTWCG